LVVIDEHPTAKRALAAPMMPYESRIGPEMDNGHFGVCA
jgi:hypothetical protein